MKDVSDLSTVTNAFHTKNKGSLFIHHNSIQKLAIELFKVENALASEIVKDVFVESNENHYNLRNQIDFR